MSPPLIISLEGKFKLKDFLFNFKYCMHPSNPSVRPNLSSTLQKKSIFYLRIIKLTEIESYLFENCGRLVIFPKTTLF